MIAGIAWRLYRQYTKRCSSSRCVLVQSHDLLGNEIKDGRTDVRQQSYRVSAMGEARDS
jgi:hypothetical protein